MLKPSPRGVCQCEYQEMTMAFVSVKTKSTTTMTTTPTTSIAITSANYFAATLTSAALAVVAHVGANRLS